MSNPWPAVRWPSAAVTVPRRHKTLFILLFLAAVSLPQAHADTEYALDLQHQYAVTINLPMAIVYDLRVNLVVPEGLIYNGDSLGMTGVTTSPSERVSFPNDGTQNVLVEWDFGDVDNSADQDIAINFNLIVANVEGNHKGVTLGTIEAHAIWRDLGNSVYTNRSGSDLVRVIEPDMNIELVASSPTAKAGDEVTYTISVYHTSISHADAFDVDLIESIPLGLTYSSGSMEIIAGPKGNVDDSKAQELHWHFDKIDESWAKTREIKLKFKATIDKSAKPGSKLTSVAGLAWASVPGDNPEKRIYSKTADGSISITPRPPALNLSMADYPNPVNPGGELTYTLSYRNKGGNALGATIGASYDDNIDFILADPAPDEGTVNRWTLGELIGGGSGTLKVTVRVKSSVPDKALLISSIKLSSEGGESSQDTAITKVLSKAPALLVEKTASDQFIRPGGFLNYTITYQNSGDKEATNVTVTDIVDSNLHFDPAASIPRPTKIWMDTDGTHLWWNASSLKSEVLNPGASGKIEFRVSMSTVPEHPEFDWVYNGYKIDSDHSQGRFKTLQTAVVHSLFVRKKAEREAYSTGDVINYTIIYGNDLAIDADNAVITDALPDVEYLEAEPRPGIINGNVLVWNIEKLYSKTSGTIQLYVKVKENQSELKFKSHESVFGQGYARFDRRLDTILKPDRLTNYVNITASYLGLKESDASSATIMLSDALGTAVNIIGHGSGIYSREDETQLLSKNKTIQVKTNLSERYAPSSFILPQGRSINYSSKWSEAQCAKNRVTGASISERYMYATRIDRNSSIWLGKNGSTLASETSFEGAGHIGMQKRSRTGDASTFKDAPTYESQEDYLGSFKVYMKFDEYGKNVASNRTASGIGSVVSDKRIGKSQRSFESGTGAYQTADWVQTQTSYMAKGINVSYSSVNYAYTPDVDVHLSKKWREGMWSKLGTLDLKDSNNSKPASFIGEEYSQVDYLKKSTVANGLNEMSTAAEFSGTAQYKVLKRGSAANRSNDVSLYDEYIGRYKLSRNVEIGGVARFDKPHLSISKIGKIDPAGGTFINYIVTVLNNGNHALGPVYVLDLFPPGTQYVYSSLRPSELNGSCARWTLVNLGIGASTTIELKLNMTEDMDNLANRIQASGGYNDQWVTAENYSLIQLNWLDCCPPQIWATKTACVDPEDPRLVHYGITLKNREKYIMIASITDQLPAGIVFLNSSVLPSDRTADEVSWNIMDLKPGETRTIDYWTRADQSGVFVNQAHIVVHSVDGTDFASADVVSRVEIGGEKPDNATSTWQPPACFGLNRTQQGFGDEWIPCSTCGFAETEPLDVYCLACDSSSESGSDIL
jgi:uncharacterized repeat protein (TIGR01451 family)